MIEIFRFKHLQRWDRFTIPHLHFPAHIPSERIGRLLSARTEPVDREKWSFASLQPITIHFDGTISRREVKAGKSYSLPLLWVRPGDIVLSKIDLKNGAVGVLSQGWNNVVVTTHFKVYQPDLTRLDPTYFRYLLQTAEFKKWLWANRTGADGRTEVKLEVFEDLEIPLPSLTEQRAVVADYDTAVAHARELERKASEAEAAAWTTFEASLGFGPLSPLPHRPVFVASFRDLDRWSHEGVLRRLAGGGADHKPGYPMVRLREVIADLENGWSPKCLDRPAKDDEWGVLKVSAASAAQYREEQNKALPPGLKPRPHLKAKVGDVLITRASGVANLVGVPAFVASTRDNLMISDKIFRAVFRSPSPIEPLFLTYVLRLHSVRAQIVREFSTESGMMKNVSKPVLMSLEFPLPPISEQRAMIATINTARDTATKFREKAARERSDAWRAFESMIYAPGDTGKPSELVAAS